MAKTDYILVCDERGTTRWPSNSKTWALGGFIIEAAKQDILSATWASIKRELCGTENVELKWSDFFAGKHQERINNPLVAQDENQWRIQAKWALAQIFSLTEVIPIALYVRKDRASEASFKTKDDGNQVLDTDVCWVGIFGQFAIFLGKQRAIGEVWFDQLGSRKEEARKQTSWQSLRDGECPVNPQYQALLKNIRPKLLFLDSKKEPLVQLADFVSGVVWAASEGDEEFFLQEIEQYTDRNGRTFRLLNIR